MHQASTRRPRPAMLIATVASITLTLPGAAAEARTPTPGPTDPPVRAVETMPALADGHAAVRFSVAPVAPGDDRLTLLTRWRSCGVQREDDWVGRAATSFDGVPATPHVVATDDEIRVRVDVEVGPDGAPCDSDVLVRMPVALDEPLGDRAVIDVADAGYAPVINAVDAPETGLTYSCDAGYPGGSGYTVPELLGPALPLPPGYDPPVTELRIVRAQGDEIHALGDVRPNGRVEQRAWRWREGAWTFAHGDLRCRLTADVGPNQATATWRLRGKRPNAGSKAIKVWIEERVCNGRPVYGRVAQPIWIDTGDGIVFVAATMPYSVEYDGTYIDDPWQRWRGRPGVASHRGGSLSFVDCPGIPPGPYTFNLVGRLGDRRLYDGAHFPPRERAGRSDG